MPSINNSFLKQLKPNYLDFKCFIETGTAEGDTIFAMEPHFNSLYTIEFSEKYYNRSVNKYKGKKITFLLGDSSIVFQDLLPSIKDNTIFFLDGHWSSGDTGRSAKDCPLVEEVTLINSLFVHEAIIIIDDYRLFGRSPKTGLNEDWSQISKDGIISILKSRIISTYHLDSSYAKDDRLIIHIGPQTSL